MNTGRGRLATALAAFSAAGGVVLGEAVGASGIASAPAPNQLRTPLSEAGSVGVAAGLALAGKRVVVELLDPAGLVRASESLSDALALAERSNGAFRSPMVVIAPLPAELPALPSALPLAIAATPNDAVGLFQAALAATGPVLLLLADSALNGRVSDEGTAALGEPVVLRAGAGLTLLAEGAGVELALTASSDAEVVDLRGCRDAARIGKLAANHGRVILVGHGDARPLLAVLAGAFWRLESQPVSLLAAAGANALAAAVSESLTP